MAQCPSCFQELSENARSWELVGAVNDLHDPIASHYMGAEVVNGGVFDAVRPEGERRWKPVPPSTQPGEQLFAVCPRCHYRLPDGWYESDTTCIAMAGARFTGKSVYIGVAIKQLEQLLEVLGTHLQFGNRVTAENYAREYERALYEEGGVLRATPRTDGKSYQRDPLILNLGRVNGSRRPRYLVLRDVAGEEMEDPGNNPVHLSFFGHADAVIFMFDPLSIPAVRNTLSGLIPAGQQSGGRAELVLTNVLALMGARAQTRLAVVVAKFDAIQALQSVQDPSWAAVMANPGAAFLSEDNPLEPHYNDATGQLLHQEVRSLLSILGAQSIVNQLENPSNGIVREHRFFAASALGESAEGEHLSRRGISPFRVLEPVKWALAAERVIAQR